MRPSRVSSIPLLVGVACDHAKALPFASSVPPLFLEPLGLEAEYTATLGVGLSSTR